MLKEPECQDFLRISNIKVNLIVKSQLKYKYIIIVFTD